MIHGDIISEERNIDIEPKVKTSRTRRRRQTQRQRQKVIITKRRKEVNNRIKYVIVFPSKLIHTILLD